MDLSKVHLVVLVHGLHGSAVSLSNLSRVFSSEVGLGRRLPERIRVHTSKVNEGLLATHEGIDVCGLKLANEIEEVVEAENARVVHISFIGHSLGGLLSRYAIGVLFGRGFFQQTKPLNYVSLATPHVGSRRVQKGFIMPLIGMFTSTLLSRTGAQLMFEDKDGGIPLCLSMSQPGTSFIHGLKMFERRVLYANIANDFQVPYCTAAISPRNPFRAGTRTFRPLKRYPHIGELIRPRSFASSSPRMSHGHHTLSEFQTFASGDVKAIRAFEGGPASEKYQEHVPHSHTIRSVRENLLKLPWRRFDVLIHPNESLGGLLVHDLIAGAGKRLLDSWTGQPAHDVLCHIAHEFLLSSAFPNSHVPSNPGGSSESPDTNCPSSQSNAVHSTQRRVCATGDLVVREPGH